MKTRPAGIALGKTAEGYFSLSGDLTFATANSALRQVKGLFREDSQLVFDLGGIVRTDSAGVAIMLVWLREASAQGAKLSYRNLPEQLIAIAHVAGVDAMLHNDRVPASRE